MVLNNQDLKIGVIVPVFNTENYLQECLDSITTQSYSNFELYAINDGSTDSSASILDKYAKKDPRCHVIHKKNGGVASARNVALDYILQDGSFDIVCLVDSDDVLAPNSFKTIVHLFRKFNIDFILSSYIRFDKTGIIADSKKIPHAPLVLEGSQIFDFCLGTKAFKERLSPAFSVFIGNYYFSTNIIGNIRFKESLKTCEDQDFRFKTLLNANRGLAISDVTFMYRQRSSSLSHSGFGVTDDVCMLNEWFDLYPLIPDPVKQSVEYFAIQCWWSSLRRAASLNQLVKNWTPFRELLNRMQKLFISDALSMPSSRKRIFLFSLGRHILNVYLRLNRKHIQKKVNTFE